MNRVIELADKGQDFTRLIVNDENVITNALPFQGWVWKGWKISQKSIRRGMRLKLSKHGQNTLVLKYPVIKVSRETGEAKSGAKGGELHA